MHKLSDIFNTNSLLDTLEIPDAYNRTPRTDRCNGLVCEVEQLDSSVSNEYLVDIVASEEVVRRGCTKRLYIADVADVACFKLSPL